MENTHWIKAIIKCKGPILNANTSARKSSIKKGDVKREKPKIANGRKITDQKFPICFQKKKKIDEEVFVCGVNVRVPCTLIRY